VLCERRLAYLNLVVLMIDGIHFGGQALVVALGIAEGGEKHVLGVWQGARENTAMVKGLLEDLVDRGLDLKRRYLVVMDRSKAMRARVERAFGEQVEVQRCQIHKRRNVKEYLPENCQKDYDRPMRNAYAMNNYAEAKKALLKIFRQLERINPSAARSLEEGLEETLTVHRLGIGGGVAAETGHHQSDRIVLVDGAAGGAKRKTPSVLINVVATPPGPARIFPVTGERWAQIGITAQFLIVVRTLGEFFRLRHVLGRRLFERSLKSTTKIRRFFDSTILPLRKRLRRHRCLSAHVEGTAWALVANESPAPVVLRKGSPRAEARPCNMHGLLGCDSFRMRSYCNSGEA
jgi:hypothetical protein